MCSCIYFLTVYSEQPETSPSNRIQENLSLITTMPLYAIKLEKCSEFVQRLAIHEIFSQWREDFQLKNIDNETECLTYFLTAEEGETKSLFVVVLVQSLPHVHSHVVGTVGISSKGFNLYISNLLILEQWRRVGLGTKLLKFAEEQCRTLCFSTAQLWCSEELVGFYERFGWLKQDKIEIDKDKWVRMLVKVF